jgi:hypothetical protein
MRDLYVISVGETEKGFSVKLLDYEGEIYEDECLFLGRGRGKEIGEAVGKAWKNYEERESKKPRRTGEYVDPHEAVEKMKGVGFIPVEREP